MDVSECVKKLGRGVNIIGYDPIWRSRDRARFQDKHFRLIREAGFGHVRIPLHSFRAMDDTDDHPIRDGWLEVLDWAVDQALANDLMVILDLHEFGIMGRDPEGNKSQFLAFWRQIAPRCKDLPDRVVFEILNEPHKKLDAELWNAYLLEALAIIRETNPDRPVIIGPTHWNNISALEGLRLPEDDRNIIATVHYYTPMEFTHQGASWAGNHPVGVEWQGSDDERAVIERDFAKAQAWSQRTGRPIYLGEFGAYDKGDMDSRARWTSAVARHAEQLGWGWGYWQFDSDFVVYDIDNDHWVEPILGALIPEVSK